MNAAPGDTISAAMLVIGDEILSGRTKDKNIGFVAEYLTAMGIDLDEVRIVSDDRQAIADAVNSLRSRHDYVFTSGGIGPTHDDITAESIAYAFGLPCEHDPKAMALLTKHYEKSGLEFTPARQRMARMPRGAVMIDNPVSKAPGFRIDNVLVMAGVPKIMQAMMDSIAPTLRSGTVMLSQTVECPFGEGTIGGPLGNIQEKHKGTMIGSYPRFENGNYSTNIVVRARDSELLQAALIDVQTLVASLATKMEHSPT